MSTKSKTGAKLVDSIRKSKTGTVASKTSERSNAPETPAKSRSRSTPSRSASTAKSNRSTGDSSGFSHGQRVWPD